MVNNRATLQHHPIDAHALGSLQMKRRGQVCANCYRGSVRTLGQNAYYHAPPTAAPAGASMSALQTSSRRQPPGEDTFSRQAKTPRPAFAMVDDGCPAEQYTDTDKSPTEYVLSLIHI